MLIKFQKDWSNNIILCVHGHIFPKYGTWDAYFLQMYHWKTNTILHNSVNGQCFIFCLYDDDNDDDYDNDGWMMRMSSLY